MKGSDSSPPHDRPASERRWTPRKFPHLPRLSPGAQILLLFLGWVLILLGLAGLVLPGLQGCITLVAGAAALSLVSRFMLDSLRYLFRRWPRGWRALLRTRRRVLHWIQSKMPHHSRADASPPGHDDRGDD